MHLRLSEDPRFNKACELYKSAAANAVACVRMLAKRGMSDELRRRIDFAQEQERRAIEAILLRLGELIYLYPNSEEEIRKRAREFFNGNFLLLQKLDSIPTPVLH